MNAEHIRTLMKLRKFVQPAPPVPEKCELCGVEIEPAHRHIVDMERSRILCACRPCYLLFMQRGAAGGKLRSAPERFVRLSHGGLRADEVPVGVAFFIRDHAGRVKAFYPSPAGATESPVSAETWNEMTAAAPEIAAMEPGIEAVLATKDEAWIVPVDLCYELVGRIRKSWRGFDGGREARRVVDEFFAEIGQRAGAA
jgi:hypothetical protein